MKWSGKRLLKTACYAVALSAVLILIAYSLHIQPYKAKTEKTPIYMFYFNSCESCDDEATYVDIFKSQLKDVKDEHPYELWFYNVYKPANKGKYLQVLSKLGLDEGEVKLPLLVIGNKAVCGDDEIREQLRGMFINQVDYKEGGAILPVITQMLSIGLLNGFNPCAASMLFFLLALFVVTDQNIVKIGYAYVLGRFVTYLTLGVILYSIAGFMTSGIFGYVPIILKGIFLMFSIWLAIMNFNDFLQARRGQYGRIMLQLPDKLKKWNHSIIEKASNASKHYLILVVVCLGIVISIGEFFCTGQVYVASILYLLKGKENIRHIILLLIIYVGAMCIPQLILIRIISKTKNVMKASEFFVKHLSKIKLLNCLVFLALAVWLFMTL